MLEPGLQYKFQPVMMIILSSPYGENYVVQTSNMADIIHHKASREFA